MRSAMKGVATVAVAGMALIAAGDAAVAGEGERTARPSQGVMFDVGSKHTVSYFVADDGRCNLTLMVGEKADDNGDNSSLGARIRVAIEGGKTAVVETAEGKSLEFACARGAQSMRVKTLDVVAYRAARG